MKTPSVSGPMPQPPLPEDKNKSVRPEEKQIKETVDQAAKEVLSSPPAEKAAKGWGFFSWFSWGAKEEQTPVSETGKKAVGEDEEKTGTALHEGDEEFVEAEEMREEDALFMEEPATQVEELGDDIGLIIPEKGISDVASKAAFEETTAKTEKVGKSWWQRMKGAVGTAVYVAKNPIQSYAESYASSLDKSKVIAESKATMLDNLQDPRFVEFFDMVSALVKGQADSKIGALQNGFLAQKVKDNKGLILDLVEVNLAKGFANLAKQTHEMRGTIPNYDRQPSLVSVLSMICQKGSANIDAERLNQMEEKYRKVRAKLPIVTKKMFPEIEKEPATQALIDRLIKTTDLLERNQLEAALFPDIEGASLERSEEIDEFISTCLELNKRHQEYNEMFSVLADDILSFLYPNRFSDMEIPGFLNWSFGGTSIAEFLYGNFIKDSLVNILQESYEPLEDDATRKNEWKHDLQVRLGAPDLQPVIEAPSAFAVAFAKDFIQSNPKAVTFTAWGLSMLLTPNVPTTEKQAQMAQLSQFQLANWFVESTQAMLQTEDPHLLGLGRFVNNGLNNVTLALLAKGANLAIPEDEVVKENQFIKELTDRMVAKVGSFTGEEEIPEQFWKDFVQDLPLPPAVKELLVPLAIEKAKSLQALLKDKTSEVKEIDDLYVATESKVRGFKRGEELLSISEKISERVISQLLEKNIGLISTFGLGDTFEELLTQYLPGVKIDDDLKEWFKENLSALGVSKNGGSPKSVEMLKRGIQAVILKALVNTIETNFKNDSEDYAAQLLNNIHQAFIKALSGFDESQRKELELAFVIQTKIQTKKDEIDALGKVLAEKPKDLTSAQMTLLDETLQANMRFIKAQDYIASLDSNLDETLRKLNQVFKGEPWTKDELPLIGQALVLHHMKASAFSEIKSYKANIEEEIKEFESGVHSQDEQEAQAAREAIDVREILLDLLDMSSDELKLISEAVNVHATINHAELAKEKLEKDLEAKQTAVDEHGQEKLSNRRAWEMAIVWMKETLPRRDELHQLTKEVADLNRELDSHLKIFQVLSNELTGLLGLDQKDKLKLPPFLQDTVWPLIESAKNEHIARLLFEQLTPMILVITDVQKNKGRLKELSKGDTFLIDLAATTSAEVVSRLSDFVANYRPFAEQILNTLGVDAPTKQEIDRMEAALRLVMIDAGRGGVAPSMLKPLLKDIVPQDKEEAISLSLKEWIADKKGEELSPDQMLKMLKKEITPQNKMEEEQLEKDAKYLAHTVNEFLINHGKGNLKTQDLLDAYQAQVEGRQKKIPEEGMKKAINKLFSEKIIDKIKTVVITHEEIAQALNEIIPGAKDLHTLIAPQLEAVLTGQDEALKANRKFVQDYIEGMLLQFFVKVGEANAEKDQNVMAVLARKIESTVPTDEALKSLNDRIAQEVARQLKDEVAPTEEIVRRKTQEVTRQMNEEVARQMIDQVLSEVLGIKSSNDLDGIPTVLRKIGYEKLKEKAYQQLTPILIPMIEVHQNRAKLQKLSGSKFLGKLAGAISKDLFAMLPLTVNSYRAIGSELFVLLSGRQPTSLEADRFAQEIAQLAKLNQEVSITSEHLAQAYAKAANVTLTGDALQMMSGVLEKRQALNAILNVLITPEEMTAAIGAALPTVDSKLLNAFAGEMQSLVHNSPTAYQHFSGFAEAYAEGMLLKVLILVAEKNPPQKKKDTLIVLTEKLLDAAAKKFEDAKTHPPEKVAQELNDLIMQELLGIDSPEAFEGLPDPLKETVYLLIKDQLGGMLIRVQQSLATLGSGEKAVEEEKIKAKMFGVEDTAAKGYAQILSEDLANMVVTTVPDALTEMGLHQMHGVNAVSKGIVSYLEDLARGNLAIAKVLLTYSKGEQFQEMLGVQLDNLAAADQHVDDKKKAAELLGNLILSPLNQVLDKAIAFEKSQGEAFDQKLMANILVVAAGHFRNLNVAKKLAEGEERTTLLHRDFVAAAGKNLHPAVPVEQVTYQKTIDAIGSKIYGRLPPDQNKKWKAEQANLRNVLIGLAKEESKGQIVLSIDDLIRAVDKINMTVTGVSLQPWQLKALKEQDDQGLTLKELFRKETEAPAAKRLEEAYGPATKTVMKMMFPNGKKDLTFVPPELRSQVWKIFENNLFPIVLPMITEMLLDPDVINSMILNSLETTIDSLKGPIVLEEGEAPERPLDDLDRASGALISEMLKTVKLPEWIKKKMINPETGEVYPEMQKTLGAVLRKQFNGQFIKDKLELALQKVAARDEEGNYLLKPDLTPKSEKMAKAADRREAVQKNLKRATREVVDVSISYFIRSKWAQAQARFDDLITRAFGKIGLKLKQALDDVFAFIFFKVIGTILNILFYPIKGIVKSIIYRIISLDENREILLSLLTKAPVDQPLTEGHVVYQEDLIYRMGEAIKQTVDEFLNEPVLPGFKDTVAPGL